jgi:hypothetical protein
MGELYNRFTNDDIINPETGNTFSLKFVKRFDELYNKKLSNDGFLNPYFENKYGFKVEDPIDKPKMVKTENILAPDLWSIINKDIQELENELSNEPPEDGDEIDENREPEKRQIDFEEHKRESPNIDENDACIYCKKHLSDDSIKTIIRHENESRIIKFCSFKCFEDKDDWNKFKMKKARKVKKHEKKEAKKLGKKPEIIEQEVKDSRKRKAVSPVIKLSKQSIKLRKKLIKKVIKKGTVEFDRMAIPKMTLDEIKEVVKEHDIKLPKGKKGDKLKLYVFQQLHPNSKGGLNKLVPNDDHELIIGGVPKSINNII